MILPTVPPLALILARLQIIFPEGTEHRTYVIREMAAKVIYVMFYAGAIDGWDCWIRPSQVTDMTDAQALLLDDASREAWIKASLSSKKQRPTNTWYAVNSREPVRDETIRTGFIPCRAVVERMGIAATSSRPKYALNAAFSYLFDSNLTGDKLVAAINAWQTKHLNKQALARVQLVKLGATTGTDGVEVVFPNGEKRSLKADPSSPISKAVIEDFAKRFLKKPVVLWLSEPGNKVVARDDHIAQTLGLVIDAKKNLPDIILVDMGTNEDGDDFLVVFVEVVASDGPINKIRKNALMQIALDAKFNPKNLAFLSAYKDRSDSVFRKNISELAWGSYAWFMSEPEFIMAFSDDAQRPLSGLKK